MPAQRQSTSFVRQLVAFLILSGTFFYFFYPAGAVIRAIYDPALNGPGAPEAARRLHQNLSPKYERWAKARVAAGNAENLSIADISGTEWPIFGSVFYLRAEEAMQAAWEKDPTLFRKEPRIFARGAIDASIQLILDPKHAGWVKQYWGDTYLEKENVFYRMLLISGMVSHHRLTGSQEHLPFLRTQTESLAAELAASPHGLLDDYPGQCYPFDVLAAWEAIQRADAVLGTDHSPQIAAARRGFIGERVSEKSLPPFLANSKTGQPLDYSLGCANSPLCSYSITVWPDLSAQWYRRYEELFWQRDWLAAGFREFLRNTPNSEYTFHIDSGPVIRGNGFASCAFGIGAARAHGRFDHAYPLSIEALALSWPKPFDGLRVPRLASDLAHAPYLGEVALLYQLSHPTHSSEVRHHRGSLPAIVFICLGLQLGLGLLFTRFAFRVAYPKRRPDA